MKIKSDFVTNSSSTGYIVAIPNDFYADQEDVLKKFEYHNDGTRGMEEWHETKILGEVEECIELLKEGDNLWNWADEATDNRVFYTIIDICEEQDFTLCIFAMSNEGNTRIQGLTEEDMNKWFMNTQLQKLKIEVPDEQNKNS